MSIRRIQKSDYPAIFNIYENAKLDELRFEENHYVFLPLVEDERRFRELKESEIYVYDDGNVIAYGAIFAKHIRAIYVHSDFRGRGIGTTFLEFFISKINGKISLDIAKHNLPAKKLYEKYGFEVVNEFTTSYNGIDAIANKMVLKR